jgi:hypothetical protein
MAVINCRPPTSDFIAHNCKIQKNANQMPPCAPSSIELLNSKLKNKIMACHSMAGLIKLHQGGQEINIQEIDLPKIGVECKLSFGKHFFHQKNCPQNTVQDRILLHHCTCPKTLKISTKNIQRSENRDCMKPFNILFPENALQSEMLLDLMVGLFSCC